MAAQPPAPPPTPSHAPPLVIWRIADGKPGHENQSLGLARALARRTPTAEHRVLAPRTRTAMLDALLRHGRVGAGLPTPDLVLAAGHRTHAAAIAARRSHTTKAHRPRTVVLMRPSLPIRWFDLVIAPAHDNLPPNPRTVSTKGALHTVSPGAGPRSGGVILLGGPSAHYGWNPDDITAQLQAILQASPGTHWDLTTSRRTPDGFVPALLRALPSSRLRVTPVDQTPPGWVAKKLATAQAAWVTQDSVSMVYEALSAGAAVGLLRTARVTQRTGRVAQGIDSLAATGWATRFDDWARGTALAPPPEPLQEADRCAHIVLDRFFPDAPKANSPTTDSPS